MPVSAVLHMATCKWHLRTFSRNASSVRGREQSLGADAPDFIVLDFHKVTLHSVIDVHDSVTFPYAAHMNFVAC